MSPTCFCFCVFSCSLANFSATFPVKLIFLKENISSVLHLREERNSFDLVGFYIIGVVVSRCCTGLRLEILEVSGYKHRTRCSLCPHHCSPSPSPAFRVTAHNAQRSSQKYLIVWIIIFFRVHTVKSRFIFCNLFEQKLFKNQICRTLLYICSGVELNIAIAH